MTPLTRDLVACNNEMQDSQNTHFLRHRQMKFDRNIKKGDLVYFNEEYRRIFSDNALGIVVQEDFENRGYFEIWWFDLNKVHREDVRHIEVISEAR
mgnify:CR=1 FL=1